MDNIEIGSRVTHTDGSGVVVAFHKGGNVEPSELPWFTAAGKVKEGAFTEESVMRLFCDVEVKDEDGMPSFLQWSDIRSVLPPLPKPEKKASATATPFPKDKPRVISPPVKAPAPVAVAAAKPKVIPVVVAASGKAKPLVVALPRVAAPKPN